MNNSKKDVSSQRTVSVGCDKLTLQPPFTYKWPWERHMAEVSLATAILHDSVFGGGMTSKITDKATKAIIYCFTKVMHTE